MASCSYCKPGAMRGAAAKRKSVVTTLYSQWNHTSFLAETSEFIAAENPALFWTFMDNVVSEVDGEKWVERTDEFEYETATRIGSALLGGSRTDLLKLALSLRLYSPRVQVQQQIGEEYATECTAFVDLGGVVVCKPEEVEKLARDTRTNYGQPWLYSVDKQHQVNSDDRPTAILYADVGSSDFAALHKALRRLSAEGLVRYYIRHYARRNASSGAHPVGLSGYGVELAIKNTEYKAVDDSYKAVDDDKDEDDLHGFDFGTLKQFHSHATDSLNQLKAHIAEMEELAPLKQWEVTDLSYQAAQRIMAASPEEALSELIDLAQNFPLRSRLLVRTKVTPALKKEVQANQAYLSENYNINEGDNALLVNGINVDTDVLDVFQLYDTIRSESRLGASFYDMGFRREYLSLLYNWRFGSEKASHALDYREANPEYLNNLDKDRQYSNWGNSVKALLQPTYMGMLRPIARNFFNLILMVDLANVQTKSFMSVGHSLYMHKVPIRVGYIFVVNQDKKKSGMDDVGIALLNLYNFAKIDRNSAPKALDLLTKAMQFAESDFTAPTVHQFFKKKFPDVTVADVFGADSDYDNNRISGATFLKRSGIGNAPKVLLNGVALDDSALTPDRIEEAILMQIMRQTAPLQRAVMTGKLTDKDNVLNWILSQPSVLSRLNARLITEPTEALALDSVFPCKASNLAEFEKLNEAQQSQCIHEKMRYLTHSDEKKTRWLTVWLAADFETAMGAKLLLGALEALKKSDVMRLGLIHTGDAKSQTARALKFLLVGGMSDANLKEVLRKAATDRKWLVDAVGDFAKIAEIGIKVDAEKLKKKFAAFSDGRLDWDVSYARSALKLSAGGAAVVANGAVYGPLRDDETFDADDFTLLQQLGVQKGVEAIAESVGEWSVDVASGKSSDVIMRSVAALGKYATRGESQRQYISVSGDSESVVHVLATDPKRPVVDLVLVVEPLSKVAQKLSAIVSSITRAVNCDIRIILNPKGKLSELPLKRFYRFALAEEPNFDKAGAAVAPLVSFSDLPSKQLLTLSVLPPDAWMVQSVAADYDLDNIKMQHVTGDVVAKFELVHLLLEGHTFDDVTGSPPRGLQFILGTSRQPALYDTIVMANLGYLQLKARPGAWLLQLREGKSKSIYEIHSHSNTESGQDEQALRVLVDSFLGRTVRIRVGKRPGKEEMSLLSESTQQDETATLLGLNDEEDDEGNSIWSSISNKLVGNEKHEQINIFSLASGHLYERFMRIMILSVIKNTKHPVKFWLLNNYLSPQFRNSLHKLAAHYKFDYELVEYKWPRWLHQQSEKQRVMWGFKVLFLDVLFPLDVRKIIFVDADQVVRADMMELMNFDLGGAPYAYVPFCESRKSMDGFRFWKQGYWASHLAGRRYHISALYAVDLVKFRQIAAGDRLRGQYQGLSSDPNSLSNLDQDLPNNMIHQVRIKSLPQEWLWCETWCSDESKSQAKTIDLCNNPQTKEPKLDSAVRIIPEWTNYDEEIKAVLASTSSGSNTTADAVSSDVHQHGEL